MSQLILFVDDEPKVAASPTTIWRKTDSGVTPQATVNPRWQLPATKNPTSSSWTSCSPPLTDAKCAASCAAKAMCRSSCSQPCPRRSTRSPASKSVRMTISPSHSRFAHWLRVFGRSCAEHRVKSKHLETSEHTGLK